MANHSTRVYENMVEMLSSEHNPTPMVRVSKAIGLEHASVYAKLEWYNPFGAVKDRVAANMVRDAQEKGLLADGQKLVEPTSGNTGLGLAMMANVFGYSLYTPLSNQIPPEKRTMLRFFGAHVEELQDTLCPAPWAPEGAIARAMELADRPDFHMLNQYKNVSNIDAHVRTTGPEIWRQTEGKVTHFVAGLGTCGTITGNGRFLKSKNPEVQVIAVHPKPGHNIPGVRSLVQLEQTDLFKPDEYDAIVEVDDKEAFEMCLKLNREDSIIAGPSAAMALCGALKVVEDEPDAVVVVIFPDNAFKYVSSLEGFFPEIRAERAPGQGGAPDPKADQMKALIENARNPHTTLEVADLKGEMASGQAPLVVDVRSAEIFGKQHVRGALNLPTSELSGALDQLPTDRNAPIVTVCNRGNMSLTGMLVLNSLGFTNVRSLNGGTFGWAEEGGAVDGTEA